LRAGPAPGQAPPVVADRQPDAPVRQRTQPDPDPACPPGREGVLEGVREELADDQAERHRGIEAKGDVVDVDGQGDGLATVGGLYRSPSSRTQAGAASAEASPTL
jgi:hypothetical protein